MNENTSPIDKLTRTVTLLLEKDYLDTSFDSKEVRKLAIQPLSKEEALERYKSISNVWGNVEENMPYETPEAKSLDIMIMKFSKDASGSARSIMETFNVRPLTYEELIQYGIKNPSHQEQKIIVGLGTIYSIKKYIKRRGVSYPHSNNEFGHYEIDRYTPVLGVFTDGTRWLFQEYRGGVGGVANNWRSSWDDKYRFPVVCK